MLAHHSEDWGPCLEENRRAYLDSLKADGEIGSLEQIERLHKAPVTDKAIELV